VFGQGLAAPGVRYVDVRFTNNGQGESKLVRITGIVPRTLAGIGTVTVNTARTLPLPIVLPDLLIGQSATARLFFDVPAGVTRFGITESGTLTDKFGRPMTFSAAQSVVVP